MLGANHAIVSVWHASLESSEEQYVRCLSMLSPYERQRAARFRQFQHHQRFVTAHGQLRLILSQYLAQSPELIEIVHNEHGKPFIADSRLQFNLAHVNDVMLCALTWNYSVGIDVEDTLRKIDIMLIARTFFTQIEVQQLEAQSSDAQRLLFFHLWTRKEAYLKARGVGLKSIAPSMATSLKSGLFFDNDGGYWSIYSFSPESHLYAALVTSAKTLSIELHRYNV